MIKQWRSWKLGTTTASFFFQCSLFSRINDIYVMVLVHLWKSIEPRATGEEGLKVQTNPLRYGSPVELFSKRKRRLVLAQLSNKFGYYPFRTAPIVLAFQHLSGPSSPSTKDLHAKTWVNASVGSHVNVCIGKWEEGYLHLVRMCCLKDR